MRAVRLLHDLEVAGKKLVAKVDAKNKLLLDNYKEEEVQASADDEKQEDDNALSVIAKLISEHQEEIDNFENIQSGKKAFICSACHQSHVQFIFDCVFRATNGKIK